MNKSRRTRQLDPGFFLNEDLGECSAHARLMFSGLWCWADRRGRLEDRPKRLRAEILPYDSVDGDALLRELAEHGLIERYEVEGLKVIQVVNFERFQNPHPNETESVLPDRSGVRQGGSEGEPKENQGITKVPPCQARPSQPSRPPRPSSGGNAREESWPELDRLAAALTQRWEVAKPVSLPAKSVRGDLEQAVSVLGLDAAVELYHADALEAFKARRLDAPPSSLGFSAEKAIQAAAQRRADA